jgi:Family of unknown function (DUF6361)
MSSAVSWLDYSEADQQRVRDLLQMFTDKATVDDLGFGTIRDAISNQLFPGTSVIQTRARYFLFIPWIFQRAQERHPTNAVLKAQDMERLLIGALLDGGESDGVIGREAGTNLKTLPSAIYWGGLQRYGIFRARGRTIRQYGQLVARGTQGPDFEGELVDRVPSFWAEIPPAPADFFRFEAADFAMSQEEAEWLAERFLTTGSTATASNLLCELVRGLLRGESVSLDTSFVWEAWLPSTITEPIHELIFQARQFSYLANGAALLYNLMLTEAYDAVAPEPKAWATSYVDELEVWADEADAVGVRDWCKSLEPFWTALAVPGVQITTTTRQFVNEFAAIVRDAGPAGVGTDKRARVLVRNRELAHKRGSARFRNEKRLLAYPGYAGTGQMAFRWPLVSRLLTDLAQGLPEQREDDALA